MVLKGQFLERPTLIPVGGLVLEGVSHRGHRAPGVLVLPPPPSEGGGMDTVVGAELAFAVSRAGHPTLRFNYRGVGGSQGERNAKPEALLEDALAALELAMENTRGEPVVIASIGASDAVALELIRRGHAVCGVALISPSLATPADVEGLAVSLTVVVPEHEPRADWGAALLLREEVFTVVPGADRAYNRNLPLVGKAVADFVTRLSSH